jgi:hypothetical protein
MGRELKEDEDWLGFDKFAKMLGELPGDDMPQPESSAEPAAEDSAEAEIRGKEEAKKKA